MKKEPKLIRVTSVLSFVESAWKEYWWRSVGFEAADKISKDSAEFGTSVHRLVQSTLEGMNIEPESNEQMLCANAILEYLQKIDAKPMFETWDKSLEIEVKDVILGLVGHFDGAVIIDGVPTIIDFKTSNKMRKSFPLQKAAYAKMLNKKLNGVVEVDTGLTIRSHWNKETQQVDFEIKEYKNLMKTYWPKFKACLDCWKYFNRAEK